MINTTFSKILSLLISLNLFLCFIPTIETNAASPIETLISIAESQIGTEETGANNVKYNTWYYGKEVNSSAYPWCAVFVAWCANQAGISNQTIPQTSAQGAAGCDEGVAFFRSKGRFRNSLSQGGTYTPSRGDIIYFSKGHTLSDSTHVGIVTGCSNGYVYTIEGNKNTYVDNGTSKSSDGIVWYGQYSLTDAYVIGYGIPDYSDIPLIDPEPNGEKYIVMTESSNLNIRSSASTSASVIGKAPKDAVVNVIEFTSDGQWAKIYYNGITGYSSSQYLKKVGSSNNLTYPVITTNKEFFNIGEVLNITWTSSSEGILSHYQIVIEGPNGIVVNESTGSKASYDYTLPGVGAYVIKVSAISNNGGGSLTDIMQVSVEPPTRMISAPTDVVEVNMDYGQKCTVHFRYMNLPDSVTSVSMSHTVSQSDIVNLSWGDWEGTQAPLVFSGRSVGETDVTVTLKNSSTGEVLDSITVHVIIKGTVKLSVTQFHDDPSYVFSGIDLNMAEGERTYGYLVVTAGTSFDSVRCTADSSSIVEIRWNNEVYETSNQKIFGFDVIPQRAGKERIEFSYILNGKVVATTYIDLMVYTECAVLQFYDNGRLVMTQEAQPGDKFEKYINILKHPTTDGQPSFIGWYTAEYGGEKYTDDMVINDFSVISLYARYDNYVEPIEPPTEPSTEPDNPYVPDEPDVPVGETKTLMFLKNTEAQISLNVRSVDAEVGKYIYDYLPIIPQEYANVFDGWYTSKTGGRKIIETDKVENGSYTTMFIYAHWKNEDGDANYDGKVTVADAVMLQKWLLGSGELTCWQNVDLCKDERIDVFDLCLLKRMIIEN